MAAIANKPFAVVRRLLIMLAIVVSSFAPDRVDADSGDGYDSPLAQNVRSATERYRLVVWAQQDGYVQTTDYIASFGTMYTNHTRFNPQSLRNPTVLVYDAAGRLVACGYQFLTGATLPPDLTIPSVHGWYDIPKHVHYNVIVNGVTYYAQQPWPSDEQPTAAALTARKLMPADGKLLFAFVHPPTRAVIIWAWLPNPNGLFESDNPALP